MLEQLWFWLVAILLAGYVLLDGFDLGAGAIHLFVARTSGERASVIKTIGPVWDGNEVWLLAAGGTIFFAFPVLYASAFSGFYLPLMMVLWLLILRGCSVEFRNHIEPGPFARVWIPVWDTGFAVSSALLAVFLGAALGNVVRGVPLDGSGEFFLPLWTDFRTGSQPGILDWYTILIGLLALAALSVHGAMWVAYKTQGPVRMRAQRTARLAVPVLALLTAAGTAASLSVQPLIWTNLSAHPLGFVFPVLALGGFAGMVILKDDLAAFASSCAYLLGMLLSAAFGLFPYLLPSNAHGELGLTIYNSAPAAYGLGIGLYWWIPGVLLAILYTGFVYHRFAGKVN